MIGPNNEFVIINEQKDTGSQWLFITVILLGSGQDFQKFHEINTFFSKKTNKKKMTTEYFEFGKLKI